ncbi:MAG: hypothetical protein RMY64_30440, partial [Nostoc sp. DedQUE08]|uniref:hypothetical protein n=1 Tax=Nostoc sp. DedQUE08 TaxID=3075393 RepID=UPI002AD3F500
VLPSYFRWMAPIYVPLVTRVLFGPLRKQAGVKAEEVEEAPEFIPFLPWILRAISLGRTAYKTASRR